MFDLSDGTVVKVFRRVQQTHAPVQGWDDHEFIIRQLFATELRAYDRLQSSPELLPFVPKYFGRFETSGLGLVSSNAAEPLLLDCALRLERVDGHDIKIAHVPRPLQQQVEVVLEQIRDMVGQINVWDCSCFIPGARSDFTIIDFALWEQWAHAQLHLEEQGTLSADFRERERVRWPDA